jgi:hypothetical protein
MSTVAVTAVTFRSGTGKDGVSGTQRYRIVTYAAAASGGGDTQYEAVPRPRRPAAADRPGERQVTDGADRWVGVAVLVSVVCAFFLHGGPVVFVSDHVLFAALFWIGLRAARPAA